MGNELLSNKAINETSISKGRAKVPGARRVSRMPRGYPSMADEETTENPRLPRRMLDVLNGGFWENARSHVRRAVRDASEPKLDGP